MGIVRPIRRPLLSPLSSPLRASSGLPWEDGGGGALWSPMRLTSLRGWYRADLGITLAGSDVDAWADQSGVGNHLTAAAGTNRPLYVASAINGQPAVRFEGTDDWLRDTSFDLGGDTSTVTIAGIVKHVTLTSTDIFASLLANNRPLLRQNATNKIGFFGAAGGGIAVESVSTSSYDTYGLVIGTWNGSAQTLYGKSATQEDQDANTGSATASGGTFALGAAITPSNHANEEIAEFIVMRAVMTADERTALRAYVLSRYGV